MDFLNVLNRLTNRVLDVVVGLYNAWITEVCYWLGYRKHQLIPIDDSFPVVSLTSYGQRFRSARLTVMRLLMNHDLRARIILWVADSEYACAMFEFRNVNCTRFSIKPTRDIRSFKKLIPSVELFGYEQSFLCLDDDVVLPISAPLKLIAASKSFDCVLAGRCHKVGYRDDGTVNEYLKWTHECKDGNEELFFTGTGMVYYPPHALAGVLDRIETLVRLCPTSDDLVFNAVVVENGFSVRYVDVGWKPVYWLGSQKVSLTEVNVIDGGNDIQLERIAGQFSNVKWLR